MKLLQQIICIKYKTFFNIQITFILFLESITEFQNQIYIGMSSYDINPIHSECNKTGNITGMKFVGAIIEKMIWKIDVSK